MDPKIRFKLSPELSDGQHYSIVDTEAQLAEAIHDWIENNGGTAGESFTVETVAMTDDEVAALPDL